jgi:hypothetical protein
MVLFLFNAVFILSMGLLPGAVLHDVNRLMLPVLPFLGGLASCGFFVLIRTVTNQSKNLTILQGVKNLQAKLIVAIFLLVLFQPALDLLIYHPYQLSYYNRLVGGIRGAYQRGLEVTYFMEALTPEFLRFLNKELPPNSVINASVSNFMLNFYQKENRLRRDIRITDSGDFDYYILLTRQTVLSQADRLLIYNNPRPYTSILLDGVPLVSVYKVEDLT